jgi:hypothetical protein
LYHIYSPGFNLLNNSKQRRKEKTAHFYWPVTFSTSWFWLQETAQNSSPKLHWSELQQELEITHCEQICTITIREQRAHSIREDRSQ